MRGRILRPGAELEFVITLDSARRNPRHRRRVELRHRVVRSPDGALGFPRVARTCYLAARYPGPPGRTPCSDGSEFPVRNPSAIAVAGDSVWVVGFSTRALTRLDANTGRLRGITRIPRAACDIEVGLGALWVYSCVTGPEPPTLVKIDVRSGRVLRESTYPGNWSVFSGMTLGLGWVWLAVDGGVLKVDPRTGRVRRVFSLGAGSWGQIVSAGDAVWVSSGDTRLVRIDRTGTAKTFDLSGAGAQPNVTIDVRTRLLTSAGAVYASPPGRLVRVADDGSFADQGLVLRAVPYGGLSSSGRSFWETSYDTSVLTRVFPFPRGRPVAIGGDFRELVSRGADLWVAHSEGVTLVRGGAR